MKSKLMRAAYYLIAVPITFVGCAFVIIRDVFDFVQDKIIIPSSDWVCDKCEGIVDKLKEKLIKK